MTVGIEISHAKWDPRRHEPLSRLVSDLRQAHIVSSQKREHASVWAKRTWEYALGFDASVTHIVFLNDDVTVPLGFLDACEAMTTAVPDKVIALHTSLDGPRHGAWQKSYWLTGPGYIIPRVLIPHLLAFAKDWAHYFATVNEDRLIMQWAWSRQDPIWHAIPALVKHDASIPSTLGYDDHAGRVTNVAWDTLPHAPLDVESWWIPDGKVPLVPCPWVSTLELQRVQQKRGKPDTCSFCGQRPSKIISMREDAGVCASCLSGFVVRAFESFFGGGNHAP